MRFLVTAGPTREFLDAVRFLSNPSTGKMGFAIAEAARGICSRVTLITGPAGLDAPRGVACVRVVSAREMFREVKRRAASSDVIVMAAAVSDYRPARRFRRKLKKTGGPVALRLLPNPDILEWLGRHRRSGQFLAGFAAETHAMLAHARDKLRRKRVDLIIANEIGKRGTGFGADSNRVVLCWRSGLVESLPRASKSTVARRIVRAIYNHARHCS